MKRKANVMQWEVNDNQLLKLWLLRMLVPLGGHREFINHHGFEDNAVAVAVGFEGVDDADEWLDDEEYFDVKAVSKELQRMYQQYEKQYQPSDAPGNITQNVSMLAEKIGLSETDQRILEFVICIHNEILLEKAVGWVGNLSTTHVFSILAMLLDIPIEKIKASLKPDGMLAKSGLINLSRPGSYDLQSKLDLLSNNFADDITSSYADPITAMKNHFFISSAPHLGINDYQHLRELNVLSVYLKQALADSRGGVNIFVYGYPGTGKTQLAKVLAKQLGCDLYEIASENSKYEQISPSNRIKGLRLAQHFFAQSKTILLFDEADDVFDGGDELLNMLFKKKSNAQSHKASTNQLLEDNPVITLWLSNSISGLDPAFIRRFDMLMELPIPPRQQREKIIRASCQKLIDDETIGRFTNIEQLAPAVVARAASVMGSIKNQLSPSETSAAFELMVNNTLKAQGNKTTIANDPNVLPKIYSPSFINTEENIPNIAKGLKKSKAGRLCLYGPPGTGKTACIRWLAEQLELPLMIKRGSDLVSKYVGDTEKNFAKTFEQARTEEALLMIDEMDSFLHDRRRAHCSWEVTGVNEMLTQMESFSGIFIASTNLIDNLDQAALRRFDLKIKFDFLQPQQVQKLFTRYCKELKMNPPEARSIAALNRMSNVTPGDFAAIARRHRFNPIYSADEMLKALVDECNLKENQTQPIGFV